MNAGHGLRVRALLGDPYRPKSVVGHWLLVCRRLRAHRAWITPGSYAWWRYTGDLQLAQKRLACFRKMRSENYDRLA